MKKFIFAMGMLIALLGFLACFFYRNAATVTMMVTGAIMANSVATGIDQEEGRY